MPIAATMTRLMPRPPSLDMCHDGREVAHLIKTESLTANQRQELKNEQGKRVNIEAKKIKDASGSTASLVGGAAWEATQNSGWMVMEQLTSAVLKALKDEMVDESPRQL